MKKLILTSLMVIAGMTASADTPCKWVLPTDGTKTFTEQLYVRVNETLTGPMDTPVLITFNDDKISLELDNFAMGSGDDKIYVGNIVINNVPLSSEGCFQHKKFSYAGNIQLVAGNDPEDAFWMGPYLGDNQDGVIYLTANGEINNNKLYVNIKLKAGDNDVDVNLGSEQYFQALNDVESKDANGDGSVDIADVTSVLGTMFAN